MIQVSYLKKRFGRKTVLDNVTLCCHRGIYGILGPNGAGKTTLMRCMMGLYSVSEGVIDAPPPTEIGYLPQKFGLFRELTVRDMLYYFASLKKIPKAERETAIHKALVRVNMEEHAKQRISTLSGGMHRRIGIAQAILGEPPVLFFDEPTVGLDPEERSRFKSVVRELGKTSTVLFSTHIVEDLEAVCDSVIVMNKGHILYSGEMDEICEHAGIKGEDEEVPVTLEHAYFAIIKGAGKDAEIKKI